MPDSPTLQEQTREVLVGSPDAATDPHSGNPVASALQQYVVSQVPDDVANFLGRLALLYGVPFENLAPDDSMLPRSPESIRFFYIDANWLEALVDGAFSVGAHTRLDIRYHGVLQHTIREATEIVAGKLRTDLRGESPNASPASDVRVRTGFLMRSAAVSGWPGMEVQAFKSTLSSIAGFDASGAITAAGARAQLVVGNTTRDLDIQANNTIHGLANTINAAAAGATASVTDTGSERRRFRLTVAMPGGWGPDAPPILEVRSKAGDASTNLLEPTKIPCLRIDRLSPEVLFCILAEIPDRIELNEPAEGLHFGMNVSQTATTVALRNPNTGNLVPNVAVPVPFRDSNARVINAAGLAAALSTALGAAQIPMLDDTGSARQFLSADFAIQMVDPAHKEVIEVRNA